MDKEQIDEELERVLEELAPGRDEFINRRISHMNFAKVVFWLSVRSRKDEYVYAGDLAKFLKVTQTRGYMILNDLVRVGFLKKVFPSSTLIEFWFKRDEMGNCEIAKFFDKAQKTLGVKFKLEVPGREIITQSKDLNKGVML